MPTDYRPAARDAAVRYHVDPAIFERQINEESGFDPDQYNARSGATGIAQIIPAYHPNVNPRDPIASLNYAAKWLSELLDGYGHSYARALAAYNWGPGNVNAWNGQRSTLPAETRKYLDDILGPGWTGTGGSTGGGGDGPGDPGDPGTGPADPGGGGGWLGGLDPGAIGRGIVGGIGSGIAGFWRGLVGATEDALIARNAGWMLSVAGTALIAIGILGAVLRSDTGRTVVKAGTQAAAAAAL